MPRSKLERFAELKTFPNVYEFPEDMKGEWGAKCFKNSKPIVLELACGKADYSLALAQMFPEKNFIAVDIQGERLWVGAKKGLELKLPNLAFLRIYIDRIDQFFGKDEVDEMWITFPDPHPRKGKTRKRLTSKLFLDRYKKILKPGSNIHLKTDSIDLFEWTLETLSEEACKIHQVMRDIYSLDKLDPTLKIKTDFENKHLKAGRTINYLRFTQ